MAEQFLPAFVIGYSDSSFTNPHEAALPEEPRDCTGDFTHMGAKYWGYETRRHAATTINTAEQKYRYNREAHNWIRLGLKDPARVSKLTISTRFYTGNHVPVVEVDLLHQGRVTFTLDRTHLHPDEDHEFVIPLVDADTCHVRCYHEGGIARINLFGEPSTAIPHTPPNLLDDAKITHVSNEHYGKPDDAVKGTRQVDYMLGWESARSGYGESALFHLHSAAVVKEVIVDTYMHRLNPPLGCHVFGFYETDPTKVDSHMAARPRFKLVFDDGQEVIPDDFKDYMSNERYLEKGSSTFDIRLHVPDTAFKPLVSFGELFADRWHCFDEIETETPVTHILYIHYPNGGIHGLKILGEFVDS